jgi:hypothetical protein
LAERPASGLTDRVVAAFAMRAAMQPGSGDIHIGQQHALEQQRHGRDATAQSQADIVFDSSQHAARAAAALGGHVEGELLRRAVARMCIPIQAGSAGHLSATQELVLCALDAVHGRLNRCVALVELDVVDGSEADGTEQARHGHHMLRVVVHEPDEVRVVQAALAEYLDALVVGAGVAGPPTGAARRAAYSAEDATAATEALHVLGARARACLRRALAGANIVSAVVPGSASAQLVLRGRRTALPAAAAAAVGALCALAGASVPAIERFRDRTSRVLPEETAFVKPIVLSAQQARALRRIGGHRFLRAAAQNALHMTPSAPSEEEQHREAEADAGLTRTSSAGTQREDGLVYGDTVVLRDQSGRLICFGLPTAGSPPSLRAMRPNEYSSLVLRAFGAEGDQMDGRSVRSSQPLQFVCPDGNVLAVSTDTARASVITSSEADDAAAGFQCFFSPETAAAGASAAASGAGAGRARRFGTALDTRTQLSHLDSVCVLSMLGTVGLVTGSDRSTFPGVRPRPDRSGTAEALLAEGAGTVLAAQRRFTIERVAEYVADADDADEDAGAALGRPDVTFGRLQVVWKPAISAVIIRCADHPHLDYVTHCVVRAIDAAVDALGGAAPDEVECPVCWHPMPQSSLRDSAIPDTTPYVLLGSAEPMCIECTRRTLRAEIGKIRGGEATTMSNFKARGAPVSLCDVQLLLGGQQLQQAAAMAASMRVSAARGILASGVRVGTCPRPDCGAPVVLEPEGRAADAAAARPSGVCPACSFRLCTACGSAEHPGATCDGRDGTEQEFEALAAAFERNRRAVDTRVAPCCGKLIQKVEGCHHITCQCRSHWCFECGFPWARADTEMGVYSHRCEPAGAWWNPDGTLKPEFEVRAAAVRRR